ncbi:MAG: S8 family serine peptidase [Mariprofundaceae bacterium]|nr:S8 family serine peptidase [Mariprofundaceae bacterium]
MKKVLILCIISCFLGACGQSGNSAGNGTSATTGSISGRLFVGPTSAQTLVVAGAISTGAVNNNVQTPAPTTDFVLGEVIVQFKSGSNINTETAQLEALFAADGLRQYNSIPIIHAIVFSSNIAKNTQRGVLGATEARQQTLSLIRRLQNMPNIQQVTANHIHKPQVIPNDPKYKQQWHYPLIGLEQAWDITTGSANVIVAVLDTGIFPHPDLKPNVIAGYDFISDPIRAGDGNGIDPDPTAIATGRDSAAHGTHVAGTIAAASNNRIGVTGVAWQSKIMPVRVIGLAGRGIEADVLNGIAYAAGLANSSGGTPPKAANIINLSLGSSRSSALFQQAIDTVTAAGLTVIAAAGNSALDGNPVLYPCAYNNVICVGAVSPNYRRATYSEFNRFIDIVAPGGEQSLTPQNGVLSTAWKNNRQDYQTLQGTSMATPHIAGIAALMLAVNPALSPTQLAQKLSSTALDLGLPGKDSEYGSGLVDAYAAVRLAMGLAATTPLLLAEPARTHLNLAALSSQTLIRNLGAGNISVSSARPNVTWLTTTLNRNTTPATLTMTANASGQAKTILAGSVAVSTSSGVKNIQVFFDNRPAPDPGVATVNLLDLFGNTVASTTTFKARGFVYQFNNIVPGDYLISAGTDRDGSGKPGDNWGEYTGSYPVSGSLAAVRSVANLQTTGINFQLHQSDDTVQFDGNGKAPIRGAILAQVTDAEGAPIAGAKVYIGDGTLGIGTSNALGRSTIFGGFSGSQTVTATATGYATLSYWQSNASYLSFSLQKQTTANVPLNVTLTGLTPGEKGILFAGNAGSQTFTATARQMLFNLSQKNNTPLAISAITYNALGAGHLFASATLPAGLIAAKNMILTMAVPTAWVNFLGSMIYPVGNFDLLSGVTQKALGFTYLGLNEPSFINGYQSIASPAVATTNMTLNMARTTASLDPYGNAVGLMAVNGLGESSMAMQLGSLNSASGSTLSATATVTLMDVPALTLPVIGSVTASSTPTFTWTNTATPMMQRLRIVDPATQQVLWEIDMDSSISSVSLPKIPSGGLKRATNYQWGVDNMRFQSFDFNNFNATLTMQSTSDFSESQRRAFITP